MYLKALNEVQIYDCPILIFKMTLRCTEMVFIMNTTPDEIRGDPGSGNPLAGTLREFASLKVSLKSFFRSQLPHKSVNVSFTITAIKNKLTDLCRN